MLHPVGSQPPSVYWRRRLLLAASFVVLIVLIVLTARAVFSKGKASPQAGGTTTNDSSPTSPAGTGTTSSPSISPSSTSRSASGSATGSGSTSGSTSAAPAACTAAKLAVAAVTQKTSYAVGAKPVVMLQVTNKGPLPCVQNLADSQVVLRVYNGESRVWGSHDCQIAPGVSERTLAVGQPVRISLVWSGLSSQPKCAGTRQRVGAGTYTLYAALAGHTGTATQFSIS